MKNTSKKINPKFAANGDVYIKNYMNWVSQNNDRKAKITRRKNENMRERGRGDRRIKPQMSPTPSLRKKCSFLERKKEKEGKQNPL